MCEGRAFLPYSLHVVHNTHPLVCPPATLTMISGGFLSLQKRKWGDLQKEALQPFIPSGTYLSPRLIQAAAKVLWSVKSEFRCTQLLMKINTSLAPSLKSWEIDSSPSLLQLRFQLHLPAPALSSLIIQAALGLVILFCSVIALVHVQKLVPRRKMGIFSLGNSLCQTKWVKS